MIHVSDKQMREIIQDHPASNFIVFTHVDARSPWHPDYLIRKALSIRYMHRGVTLHTAFSHCGSVWYDKYDEEINYWHLTFPTFIKEPFKFRSYNVFYKVDDPSTVYGARDHCVRLKQKKKGYGVARLVFYLFTFWHTWFKNPIEVGQVCMEPVIDGYPRYIKQGKGNADPQSVSLELDKAGLIKYVVDRT